MCCVSGSPLKESSGKELMAAGSGCVNKRADLLLGDIHKSSQGPMRTVF